MKQSPSKHVHPTVIHDPSGCRFILDIDGVTESAMISYNVVKGASPETWDLVHTHVPYSMRGRGIAGTVVGAAFTYARYASHYETTFVSWGSQSLTPTGCLRLFL
jgi:predicted GNAT family acetyltransferase